MAKQVVTTTEYIDDLDGGTAIGTVTFGYDGQDYEIDLSKANTKAFEKMMAPYVEHGRRIRATRSRRASAAPAKRSLSVIRDWAQGNGYEVSNRGRISAAVLEAYDAAH